MRFFEKTKDGGPDSPVTGYFLVEIKSLFSIALLHFGGTREAYHSHAFNALTIWLRGNVFEQVKIGDRYECNSWYAGDVKYTPRGLMHRILPQSASVWALSFRGPWQSTWQECRPDGVVTLTHGRKVVG